MNREKGNPFRSSSLEQEFQKHNEGGSSNPNVRAADTISKKFNVKSLLDHVDNHLRTVKTTWGIIAKLRNQSGCGWDENMRMIRMSPDVYNTYIEANLTHEKYLNKKIDMYDEMATVIGKDIARGLRLFRLMGLLPSLLTLLQLSSMASFLFKGPALFVDQPRDSTIIAGVQDGIYQLRIFAGTTDRDPRK
ncbi:hypothetical protein Cgig2_008394 [Carnegiea gigantea]|uniref:Myb/SANT-like domain-containing protein n=1 Tax=Carnegiea gigantea TaxID=171969 RepID=A0A9Q1QHD6_9CARY|nr:hypothetical protein Cgig2_008394 [Carnegiea gigantea]